MMMFSSADSPGKGQITIQPAGASPVKGKKQRRAAAKASDKEHLTDDQLIKDFFRMVFGESKIEDLEKVQLQSAIAALSEKLLLFSSIHDEKRAVEQRLEDSEAAREDLQQALNETSGKTKQEVGKLHGYQEIMLQENKVVTE